MSKLLSGYRIIESSMLLNGATTAMMLVDLGAEVIKVESPFLGDYLRAQPAHPINMHLQVNKGKRSLALDLRKPEGREVFYRLLDTADAFVTNAVGSRNDKLGIGYEQLRARKPDIVYCQNTGYGAEGLLGEMPTHGQMMDAMAGAFPMEMDERGLTRPKQSELRAPYSMTFGGEGTATGAIYAAFHLAAGLAHRARTGEGCYIDLSSADAVIANAWNGASSQLNDPERVRLVRDPAENVRVARYQFYETRDRKFVLFCPEEKKFWIAFCELVGRPDLIPQLKGVELRHEVQKIMHTKDREEWLQLAVEHRLPLGPAHRDMHEVVADRHIQSRQILKPSTHPTYGPFTYIGQPAIVDHQPYEVPAPAPDLGQHTDGILKELGYGAADIERLARSFVTTAEKFQGDHIQDVHDGPVRKPGGQGAA
ncbi:MAG: CaiB/BaiF CoA transferase family protein [Gammaproteobacteria bacterium]